MQLIQPAPFTEAIKKIGDRTPIGSHFSSSEWRDVPLALRDRAFFSSRIASIRFLQRARNSIVDFLASNREIIRDGVTALKTGSRSAFVDQMKTFLAAEGVLPGSGGLKDITSERRLGLIFDVQTRQAHDFGRWKEGNDPDLLDEFPAQRFIRVKGVQTKRSSHVPFEGQVRLKSDVDFWVSVNKDFGVPWGPWGWGCGHDVEDVDRDEAERLGLIRPGERQKSPERSFNHHLKASLTGFDDDVISRLKQALADQVSFSDSTVKWKARQSS